MALDYKKELELASKNMILIHDARVLARMIIRMLVQKVKVSNAFIFLHDKDINNYRLACWRPDKEADISRESCQIDANNPLIRFFREYRGSRLFSDEAIILDEAKKLVKHNLAKETKSLLTAVIEQMKIFDSTVCIPSFFRHGLLGIVLLGGKLDGKKFDRQEMDFFIALASDVSMAVRNAQLFKDLQVELDRNRQLYIRITIALAAAIEAKDNYTHGHTSRVTNLSMSIASKICQKNKKLFDRKFLEDLHIASLLHDIGKIGIPEFILNKEEKLTDEEINKIREHPVTGATILAPIKELSSAIMGVRYHHERYDGTGYPEGLKGERIPLIASIISVADSFDAMTSDRPYRRKLSGDTAFNEILSLEGKHYDPRIVSSFADYYREANI
ncbi:MAG: HD-GYP domain-containing protein [Candidatus Omnitrophica bacterium]|nr:HD-GYP domain-containing protein [Candidatus Omnitrophota bacterium]